MVRSIGKTVRGLLAVGALLLLSACAGGYSRSYMATEGLSPADLSARRLTPAPQQPALEQGTWNRAHADGDLDMLVASYARRGYVLIGSSVFSSDAAQSDDDAVAQGARVGADVVLVLPPHYAGSSTSIEPVMDPFPYMHGGFGFYGHRGWRHGWGYGGSMFYGSDMALVPVTVARNAFAALYFVKIRWRLGVLYRDLDDGERREIGSNKGVSVTVTVDATPAFNADILPGDVITAVNGQAVVNADSFSRTVEDPAVKELTLTIHRGDQTVTKTVPLAG